MRLKRWEVYNEALPDKPAVSSYFFYRSALNEANALHSMVGAIGYSYDHHQYRIRRVL